MKIKKNLLNKQSGNTKYYEIKSLEIKKTSE